VSLWRGIVDAFDAATGVILYGSDVRLIFDGVEHADDHDE
jgi:hypothetical protein